MLSWEAFAPLGEVAIESVGKPAGGTGPGPRPSYEEKGGKARARPAIVRRSVKSATGETEERAFPPSDRLVLMKPRRPSPGHRVDGDGDYEHDGDQHVLGGCSKADQVNTVVHSSDNQTTEEGVDRLTTATE